MPPDTVTAFYAAYRPPPLTTRHLDEPRARNRMTMPNVFCETPESSCSAYSTESLQSHTEKCAKNMPKTNGTPNIGPRPLNHYNKLFNNRGLLG